MIRKNDLKQIKIVLALCLAASNAQAFDWSDTNHQLFIGDFDGNTQQDIYLKPNAESKNVDVPYNIQLQLNIAPEVKDTLLLSTASAYSLSYQPSVDALNAVAWQAASHNRYYGDFNGDGYVDLVIQPQSAGGSGAIVLGFAHGQSPTLLQTLTADNLATNIDEGSATFSVQDINQDGLDDLVITPTTGSAKVAYAQAALPLTVGLPIDGCGSAAAKDTDCDGTTDRYDIAKYDPLVSGQVESSISAAEIGTVAASFDVTPDGKASYTVPLKMVPGVAQSAPGLSLNYNQTAGNGLMGMGWYLAGLSEISRCPTNLDQDGYINGVNFNSVDQFCFNGQRLVEVAENEYRTESDSFAKIIANGGGATPISFTVYRATGETESYGTVVNARKLAFAGGPVSAWAINRRQDREGNFSEFLYNNSASAHTFTIARINYSGNDHAGQTANNSVRFSYEARADVKTSYANSAIDVISKRLKKVETFLGNELVRRYTLNYTQGATQRSLLATLKECLGDDVSCLPQTQFNWDLGTATEGNFTLQQSSQDTAFPAAAYSNQQYHLGDVNADGLSDVIWTYRDNNHLGRVVYLAKATGDGFTKASSKTDTGYGAGLVNDEDQHTLTGDINGDGKTDLIWIARLNNTVVRTVYLSNGTGFDSQGYELDVDTDYGNFLQGRYQLADVNGDGLSDLTWVYHHNNEVGITLYLAAFKNGQIVLNKTSSLKDDDLQPDLYQHQRFSTGDVNGDGKADIVWTFAYQNKFYRTVYLANVAGGGFTKISLQSDSFSSADTDHQVQLADVNGDGKADLVWTYNDNNYLTRKVYWSSRLGTSFELKSTDTDTSLVVAGHQYPQSRLADVNGDGRQDLVYSYIQNTTFGYVTYLSNLAGTSFSRHQASTKSISSGTANHEYRFADVSGDGKADLVWSYNTSTGVLKRNTFTQVQSYPDHINRFTDGLGAEVNVQYRYLADNRDGQSIYQKGAAVSYPMRNDNGLSYIVSRVERSDGIGGLNRRDYQYRGARTHLRGRGFMGFEQRAVIDRERGFTTRSTFAQQFPLVGQAISNQVEHDGSIIEETHNDWQVTSTHSGKTQFRHLKRQGIVKRNINDGNESYAAVVLNDYDSQFGHLTKTETTTGLGYSDFSVVNVAQTVTTDYDYLSHRNIADWRILFLSEQSKRYRVAGESDRTIVSRRTPISSVSLLSQTEVDYPGTLQEQTRVYTRDAFGNATSVSVDAADIDGSNIATQINSVNRFIAGLYADVATNGEGHISKTVYDHRFGYQTTFTEANGLIADTLQDGFGHQLFERGADGTQRRYQFSSCNGTCPADAGQASYRVKVNSTHPQSAGIEGVPEATRYFDILQRPIASQILNDDGNSIWTRTRYDKLGRVVQQSEPYLAGQTVHWLTRDYDALDRVIVEQRPDGGKTTNTFLTNEGYAAHTVMTATVATPGQANKSLVSHLYHNSLGQLQKTLDAYGTLTEFDYDAEGNNRWTRVNGNAGTVIESTTDLAGNRTYLKDPAFGEIRDQFDGINRIRRRTYGAGAQAQMIVSEYDKIDRLKKRTDHINATTNVSEWSYDPANGIGKLAEVSADDYRQTLHYDALSRVQRSDTYLLGETLPKQYQYAYDAFSRPLVTLYPSDIALNYRYDDRGYLERIEDADKSTLYWRAQKRDARGNVIQAQFGNGVITQRNYQASSGRIDTIQTGVAIDSTDFQSLAYVHDSAGNLVRRSSKRLNAENLVENFGYDNLHRMTSANTSGLPAGNRNLTYGYDALGNLLTKSDASDSNGYSYGANGGGVNAVSRVTHGGVNTDYHYDFKGNMVQRGEQTLSYSIFNKPLTIGATNLDTAFQYGPDRQRIYQRTDNSGEVTETRYYNRNFEVATRGTQVREKAYVGDYLVITRERSTASPAVSEDFDYLHRDHLGSVEATSDRHGNFTGRFAFDPWGKRRTDGWQDADASFEQSLDARTFASTTRGFTDHEHLDASGLIHMNGRVYDPLIGRFLSPDDYVQFPAFSQSYNRYSYVLNNPISYTDPSGEFIPLIYGAVILSIKAYDIASAAIDSYETLTNDNLTTTEKGLLLGGQLILAVAPGGKSAEKVFKRLPGGKSSAPSKPEGSASAGGKTSQKADGDADAQTTVKSESKQPCGCFAPGTLVLTEAGYRPIETIQVGDRVAAKSDVTNHVDWKAIEKVYYYDNREYFTLSLAAEQETFNITVTDDHPFWVVGKGWINSVDLSLGDQIATRDGDPLRVVAWLPQDELGETYNFEVADYHSYFVSEFGAWVHNGGPCDHDAKKVEGGAVTKKTVEDPVDLTDFRKDHILNRHAPGTGKSDKTEFPVDWDQNKILHEISDVATDPKSKVTPGRWGADRIQGTRDGVDITVDLYPPNSKHAGKISTAYPTNTPVNP